VRDVFEPPGQPTREERMAAAFLAVPRRHPHHDDPEMRTIMASQNLTRRQPDASVATPVPIAALAGGTPTTSVILALDLGHCTGWAVRNRDGAIASGVHAFRPGRFEGGGMIWLRFRAWLQEVDETSGGLGVVVFEEVRRHAGTAASHAYGGYLAHLTAWAEANKIPYQGVPVGTIKRHVAGKGNADKQAVIEAVRRLGFAPAGDNEADALALLHWAIAHGVGAVR
jgi:hypothetical protein